MESKPNSPAESLDRRNHAWLRLAVGLIPLVALFIASRYNYLVFHTIAEIFAIVVACGTFMVAWNARPFLANGYLMLVGVSSLFVGMIDLAHTMAYRGMPFFETTSANLATQLWIAGRLLGSVSFLVAPLLLFKPVKPRTLIIACATVAGVLVLSITWGQFPDCFVEGRGLTPFKVAMEYVICLILLAAIGLLWKHRQHFDSRVLVWLMASMVLNIAAELSFTLYTDVYGISNLLGHYFKIVAFYFLYKAVIETGFAKPFALLLRENNLREQHLQAAKNELDRINEELEKRVAERTALLQETTDDLNAFVYSIAHDLRAPSRAQHGFSMMLLDAHRDQLPPEAIDLIKKIAQSALKMDALVSNLLGFVSVSREQPDIQAVDLDHSVRQVLAEFSERIEQSNAVVHCLDARGSVLASEGSVHRALWHLLDNALKFAKPGQPPEVTIRAETMEDWVRVWVEDNGIGIAPRYHAKLFGVFQRLHREGEYGGVGIGLALVKRSIQRVGGKVGVESEAGQGCRFWFALRPAPGGGPGPGETPRAGSVGSSR